jgi:hypothetical protein
MTNSLCVSLLILCKAVSSHLFLWPIACEWHCSFCERQSHQIISYDQQRVSDTLHICERWSHYICSYDQQVVSALHILWNSLIIFSYDQQVVSDIAHFVKGSLITFVPMTNRGWATLCNLWNAVSSHLVLYSTASEWYSPFCEHLFLWPTGSEHFVQGNLIQSHHIFSYDQQGVSVIRHFVKGSLTTFIPMTNREWVTLHILWNAVSSDLFLWPTASEQHYPFWERQSYHLFSMTNSLWVTLPIWWKAVSHLSCDQQYVSDVAHCVKGNLITSFCMTNREWVILCNLWMQSHRSHHMCTTESEWHWTWCVQSHWSHLFLWPTESEWYCSFCERWSHHIFSMTNRRWATFQILWKAYFPMTNRVWVTLHILLNAVSSHLIPC